MTECVITNAGNAAGYGNGSEVGTTCKCAVTDTGNAGRDGNGLLQYANAPSQILVISSGMVYWVFFFVHG